jgi:hypothetical protein
MGGGQHEEGADGRHDDGWDILSKARTMEQLGHGDA